MHSMLGWQPKAVAWDVMTRVLRALEKHLTLATRAAGPAHLADRLEGREQT